MVAPIGKTVVMSILLGQIASGLNLGKLKQEIVARTDDMSANPNSNKTAERVGSPGTLNFTDMVETQVLIGADAWLVVHDSIATLDRGGVNMYSPILYTVKEGLEAEGAVVRIIGSREFENLAEVVRLSITQGRRPLVFTVAHDWAFHLEDRGRVLDQLKEVKAAGAYLIQYQSEPAGNGFNSKGELAHLAQMLYWAARMGADEIWEYTLAHVEHYPKREDSPLIRYVPAGYTRFFDLGVNAESSQAQTWAMGYLGSYKWKNCAKAYEAGLRGHLYHEDNVWSLSDLRTYLERFPLQLNQHRNQTCHPREKWEDQFQHFETLRMSSLLANKACVISPPASTSDMKVWKDIVTFVEVEDTYSTMQEFANNPQKLQGCRAHAYETFKRDFNGHALLRMAGFISFFRNWRPPHGI